jgi:hypothetical protein
VLGSQRLVVWCLGKIFNNFAQRSVHTNSDMSRSKNRIDPNFEGDTTRKSQILRYPVKLPTGDQISV